VFPVGTKLVVKQKKSGAQRVKVLVKDPAVTAAMPCETAAEFVVQAAGQSVRRWTLDAANWKPLKAKAPEKGCKYKKGPVVATLILKAGKLLKLSASGDDLGIPLDGDPRPVDVEVRHGDVRHCLRFGGEGKHVPNKKLVSKGAAPATSCPAGS